MTSTVPAFKAALLARLTTALAGVSEVHWGDDPDKQGQKVVLIGPVSNRELQFVAAMTQANETYDLDLIVSVVAPLQESYSVLVDAAYAIADAVIDSVLSWRETSYGGVVDIVMPGQASDSESTDGDWHEAAVALSLHVTARV
jgi:hypothetical protein